MEALSHIRSNPGFLSGSEIAERIRQYNWSGTPTGDPAVWPLSLHTIVRLLLHSDVPMILFWGEELTCFYNDAFHYQLAGDDVSVCKKMRDSWPGSWNFIAPLIRQVMVTGRAASAEDQPLSRNATYWKFDCSPAYGDAGEICGVLVTCTETTSKVELSRKLKESEEKVQSMVEERTKELATLNNDLQRSNAELAQYAYIASHDLQEPLRKITTYTQLLEGRIGATVDEKSQGYMHKISNASRRMIRMIRDVLEYSELVKESEMFKQVDLNNIVKNALMDFELLIEQKEAVIEYSQLPVIDAVPTQMMQLFGNIIGNALKFSRKDLKPKLSITSAVLDDAEKQAAALDPSREYCRIEFRDNGIGFSPEYKNRIFHIFQRLHRKSEYEGTGIGLAMCKKIAQNHNGDLNASGSSENGAVFNAILPLRQL